MNATERYKMARGVYSSPAARHDHLTYKNEYWRVRRDIDTGSTGDPKLRRTRYPTLRATMWHRRGMAGRGGYFNHDPVKSVVRFLRLRRMLDRLDDRNGLAQFFRIRKARSVAYGWTSYLKKAREEARKIRATPRQQRITLLAARQRERNSHGVN